MKIITRSSPNQNARPNIGGAVTLLVLHADAHPDASPAGEKVVADWCCDPAAKVSYHAIVSRDGTTITSLVPVHRRAWHAGVSEWEGRSNVNDFSIGICLANRNDGEPHPVPQLRAAAAYCAALVVRYPKLVNPDGSLRIVRHLDVAPGRKTDPRSLDLAWFTMLVQHELDKGRAA